MKSSNYDLPAMRRELITLLAQSLKKESKWYKEDYENICKAVNSKTIRELRESLARWDAVGNVSDAEIKRNSQM